MKEVTDLIENLVENIDCNIHIDSQEYLDGSWYRVYTCDTKWARVGKIIKIQYHVWIYETTILNIEENTYIDFIYNNEDYSLSEVKLPNPFFISGTKTSTNNEWSRAGNNLIEKTPLIWLYQNYNEQCYGADNSMERTITMNIAFLDETNSKFETNKLHIDNAVKPCNKLRDEFIKSINKNLIYKTLKTFNTKTFSRFGVETDSGIIQNILDADLSGVVLNITLDKFKEPCKC